MSESLPVVPPCPICGSSGLFDPRESRVRCGHGSCVLITAWVPLAVWTRLSHGVALLHAVNHLRRFHVTTIVDERRSMAVTVWPDRAEVAMGDTPAEAVIALAGLTRERTEDDLRVR